MLRKFFLPLAVFIIALTTLYWVVKPASFYLDIISQIKKATNVPIAAFQVSGEYYMIKHSSIKGIFNSKNLILESLNSIKRSGASLIFTYFAEEVSDWLK